MGTLHMDKNLLLVIGSGGREHALGWKLKQSPKVGKIYFAPGNGGTSQIGENINIPATDIATLADFAERNKIDFTVCSSDDPLALGVVDLFNKKKIKIWGPNKKAAQIESSKAFAKDLMQKAGIPTARFQTFSNYDHALSYLKNVGAPIVIKASGLALGKGVTVCRTIAEAKEALKKLMVDKIFGDAGRDVIIEEFLQGQEFSVHVFSDGKTFKLLPPAQDHKPIFDDNQGPNTGGMGTIAPVPWVNEKLMQDVNKTIVEPILKTLKKEAGQFVGLLYPGLMQTADGPKVIEFNARFGDPETQSLMRLLKTDLFEILEASVEVKLNEVNIEWENKFACCIVLASNGYPGEYKKGLPISGIVDAEKMGDVVVFHAGTTIHNNQIVTNGGRVLGITAVANSLKSALDKAYAAVKLIHFEGMLYRTDIGLQSLTTKV